MRLESSSRSFQMTARKTSISPDFPFRNTIRYFDSDQMLEESKSLSKRKLQVEHSGGRESKVQRKQTQKRNKLQTSYQTNTSPLLFFVLFVSFLLKYARTSEGSAPASRAGALANRVRSARFALAKRARSIYTMVGGLLRRERHTGLPGGSTNMHTAYYTVCYGGRARTCAVRLPLGR